MNGYIVAKYLRLSSEDDDLNQTGKLESNSISNQRDLLDYFIARAPDFAGATVIEFCDDGWSGKNFERPAFQDMIAQAQKGGINCILVKDDCVIKARTPQTLENRHFLRIGAKFGAILRPQRTAHIIGNS